ncbi:MAG: hypothetical protein J5689_02450 [Clostridia bacterium]|nr:hypothetical protein [Clostridia bacterium]
MDLRKIITSLDEFKLLENKARENSLLQTYLFVSEDFNLRQTFFEEFAKVVLKNESKVIAKTHPDLTLVLDDKILSVESIANLVSDCYYSPLEADYKLYYIDDASKLTEEAQNKLLKTIENPPKSAIFVFGATSTSSILPTILSRAFLINIPKLDNKEIINYIVANGKTEAEAEILAGIAGGNITKANALMQDDLMVNLFYDCLELFKIKSSREVLNFSSKFRAKKYEVNSIFDLTIMIARDIMMVKSGRENLVLNKANLNFYKSIEGEFSLKSLTKIIENCLNFNKDLTFYVNSLAALDEFLFNFVEVKVTCKEL